MVLADTEQALEDGDLNETAMNDEKLKLMCVLAHPDDESLGLGGILAKYAAEGIKTYLITATGGERGWFGDPGAYPGAEALAAIRKEELRAAAKALGIRQVNWLGYQDGELDRADHQEVITKIVKHLRRVRPHVVVTFDPSGAYGHPDHIAICQFATAACAAAGDPGFADGDGTSHRVSKLYYMAETKDDLVAYEEAFGELVVQVNGEERRGVGWEPWAITTRIDTAPYWRQVWDAIACHQSQLPGYEALMNLPEERRKRLFDTQKFYRAYSLVDGGSGIEQDLFSGLR
jgi:LmbE family N-acetylglucosaminyl deacetylase